MWAPVSGHMWVRFPPNQMHLERCLQHSCVNGRGGNAFQTLSGDSFPYSKRHLAYAAVAQLVERHLAMVEVAGSSPVCRSILKDTTSNADDSISSTVTMKGTPGTDTRSQGAHGFGPCIRQVKFLPSETQWYLAGKDTASNRLLIGSS